jgi:fibronectin-binding autotransporter adhesin
MFSTLRRLLSIFPRIDRQPLVRNARRTTLVLNALEDRLVPANAVWSGAGDVAGVTNPNDDWSNGKNWVGGVAPVAGDAIIFGSNAVEKSSNNDLAANTLFSNITFQENGFTVAGNAIDLQSGVTNSSGYSVLDVALKLTAAQTITDDSGASLNLAGAIDNGGFLLSIDATGDIIFDGSSISGAGGLDVYGGAKFYLDDTAKDSYTGTTTVGICTMYLDGLEGNAVIGTLSIGNNQGSNESDVVRMVASNQIPSSSDVNIGWSGLLDLDGFTDTIGTLNMNGGNITTGTGLLTLAGNVTTPIGSTYTALVTGNISLGSGSAPITFTIGSGSANNQLHLEANLSGGSGVEFIKAGAGQMVLDGDNTYSGQTLVSAGSLAAASSDALGDSAGATVSSGAALIYQDPNADNSLTFANVPLTLNGGTLQANGNSPLLEVPGSLTLTGADTIEVGTGIIMNMTGVVSGSGSLAKIWAGSLDLNSANSYSGGTTATNGVLALGTATALGSGSVKVGSTGTLELENGLSYANSLTLTSLGNSDAALFGNGNATWSGGIALTGSSNISAAGGDRLTISGPISGGVGNNLTIGDSKDPAADGIVLLTSANTYAGDTIVGKGTLTVSNSSALGSPKGTIANGGTTVDAGATLDLEGGLSFDSTETLTLNGMGFNGEGALLDASGNNSWNGKIALATTSAIGTNTGTTLAIDGILSGSMSNNMVIEGDGTVVLSGTNTNYEGYTRIMSGIVAIDNASALGGAPYNGGAGTSIEAGATLQLEGGITYNIEPLTLDGTGFGGTDGALESVSGNNAWGGPIKLDGDTTITCEAASTFTDHVQLANEGYNLTFNAIGDIQYGSSISGTGGLIKDGTGMLTLATSAPNFYTGATAVNAGTLMLDKPAGIPALSGSGVTIESGATLAGSGTIAANVTNSGTISPGDAGTSGDLVIDGNFTQSATGILDLDISSAKSFDEFQVTGVVSLDGELNIALLNGYYPAKGIDFEVMTFGSSSGAFAAIDLPTASKTVELAIVSSAENITIDAEAVS